MCLKECYPFYDAKHSDWITLSIIYGTKTHKLSQSLRRRRRHCRRVHVNTNFSYILFCTNFATWAKPPFPASSSVLGCQWVINPRLFASKARLASRHRKMQAKNRPKMQLFFAFCARMPELIPGAIFWMEGIDTWSRVGDPIIEVIVFYYVFLVTIA